MKNLKLISAITLVLLSSCIKNLQNLPIPTKPTPPVVKPDTTADNTYLKLQLTNIANTVQSDQTLIIFNKVSSPAYIPGEDAPYFSGAGITELASLSTQGYAIAINNTSFTQGMKIGLQVRSKQANTYTISLVNNTINPAIKIWLKDGIDSVDLKKGPYQFNASAGVDTSRFKLILY